MSGYVSSMTGNIVYTCYIYIPYTAPGILMGQGKGLKFYIGVYKKNISLKIFNSKARM